MDSLLPRTRQWVESLPASIRPSALIDQYPRVTNLLALERSEWSTFCAFLDDLVHHRADGEGFPLDVRADLLRLQAHYAVGYDSLGLAA